MSTHADLNRFERARVIGARALQIAMGAPVIVSSGSLVDPVRAAAAEFDADVIPITVSKPDHPAQMRKKPEHKARPRKPTSAPR